MNTTTIYASYGTLFHEYEAVWGLAPATEAYYETDIRLPDGFTFEESIYGELLVTDGKDTALFNDALSRLGDEPFMRFPVDGVWQEIPLIVVDAD